jgi:hypothetical protein
LRPCWRRSSCSCSPRVVLPGRDRALNIGINKAGLSIGDSREWTGVRLNFRDTRLREVNGLNATIWGPRRGGDGDITGVALALPFTGGRSVRGIQVGGGISTRKLSGMGGGLARRWKRRVMIADWARFLGTGRHRCRAGGVAEAHAE